MLNLMTRYAQWLHLGVPSGGVEKLPYVDENGETNVKGVYVVGDLAGVPLLKFSANTGVGVIERIDSALGEGKGKSGDIYDVVIVGGGVAGVAAGIEAGKRGLNYCVVESGALFSTIVNFPKGKPIFTYPTDLAVKGDLQFHEKSDVKEGLLEDLHEQVDEAGLEVIKAKVMGFKRVDGLFDVDTVDGDGHKDKLRGKRVVIAIGRSGEYRELGVQGEELDKVYNRLHDPKDYCDKKILVVGGGDSALETAIALGSCGGDVTVSYRQATFNRAKFENVEGVMELAEAGKIELLMGSKVKEIKEGEVVLVESDGGEKTISNDVVFTLIGRHAPLQFFRDNGLRVKGDWRVSSYVTLAIAFLAAVFVYHWKKPGTGFGIGKYAQDHSWFPSGMSRWWEGLGGMFSDSTTVLGTLKISVGEAGFYYSLAYCLCVFGFGMKRIRLRKTQYVKVQTWTLICIQWIPLFLLPYLLLPWMGNNGWFDSGFLKAVADEFMPVVSYGHGREYWRAFGLILAWPLFFFNVFTDAPMWGWLIVSLIQTFVIIPFIVWRWGKGAYCGWICSCGALAETVGDSHREKMPHGKVWNKANFIGQVFLGFAMLLLVARIVGWIWPESGGGEVFAAIYSKKGGLPLLNYVWFVDLFWAGIMGVGLYWHFSGRVWCRFACPLAALMHIYAKFSMFRILSDKKKCISCNVCTSVCHQGIDVMSYANKGLGMDDTQCVRCSACVSSCPTGVLSFGQVNRAGDVIKIDKLQASMIQLAEVTVEGNRVSH